MGKDSPGSGAALGGPLELMRLLAAVDHGFQATSKWMLAQQGVTAPQRLVLRILEQAPGTSAGDLARMLYLHPSTLTGVLKRLERGGLVRRRTDPDDGRRAILDLTPKGRRVERSSQGTVEAAVARTLQRLSSQTVAQTRRALLVLAEELGRR